MLAVTQIQYGKHLLKQDKWNIFGMKALLAVCTIRSTESLPTPMFDVQTVCLVLPDPSYSDARRANCLVLAEPRLVPLLESVTATIAQCKVAR
jgi:hypothetical protein